MSGRPRASGIHVSLILILILILILTLTLTLAGCARLKLHAIEDYRARPLEEVALVDTEGPGALYQVTMAASSGNPAIWKAACAPM